MIAYRVDDRPELEVVIELYRASTLGARRPIDDRPRFAAMIANANLIVTAWDGATLVGIARSLSDFAHCTYLADLAVRASHQRQGIGRELIRQTRAAHGPLAKLLLLSAPAASDYYPRVGFTRVENGWLLEADQALR